jgi:putative AlgH/UPF0301 family transcriptional regulator
MNVLALLPLALCLAGLPLSNAQYRSERQLSVGDILIANEKLGDPNFAESVVLIVQYDEDEGTVGIIINRRTDIPVSKIFRRRSMQVTISRIWAGQLRQRQFRR